MNGQFMTTHWTVVRSAGSDDTLARQSLESLCQNHWYPLYVYVRRQGCDQDRAEDLIQSFFCHLIEKSFLKKAQQEKGRFRSFLLKSIKNFLCNEWDKSRALKRGGGKKIFSIDYEDAESKYKIEPQDVQTAEALYERRWALNVLELALKKLELEMKVKGKKSLFDHLKVFLNGKTSDTKVAEIAQQLDMKEGTLKTAASRLRKRYRILIKAEISETLDDDNLDDDNLDDEYQTLLKALTGN